MSMRESKRSAHTLAAQAGIAPDPANGAIIPPIHLSTTFERSADGSYPLGRHYIRADNPTYDAAEKLIATLETGDRCLLFPSGVAAATSVFMALEPGAKVVAPEAMYWSLRKWLRGYATRWGIETTFVDASDPAALRSAIRPGETRLVWVETPANPIWTVTDIAAAADVAHEAGALLAVDNTVSTPILTRPLELGADVVMHSATKYLNGHGDVVAGALVYREPMPLADQLVEIRSLGGPLLGSMEAWLLLRGLRTLPMRVERSSRSAMSLAQRLRGHRAVAAILYPGLEDHPQHEIAARQMDGGFGGVLSIVLHGGEAAALAAASRVRLWTRATSFGGLESLIEHRASIEGPESLAPGGLLRLSVGAEDPDELAEDLIAAIEG